MSDVAVPAPTDTSTAVIAVLGGTGEQGRGLARRFALAGHRVVLGSRDAGRAADAAETLPGEVSGKTNAEAAAEGDVVIVAVPWEGHRELLAHARALLPEAAQLGRGSSPRQRPKEARKLSGG